MRTSELALQLKPFVLEWIQTADSAGVVSWDDIAGRPATFAPSAHGIVGTAHTGTGNPLDLVGFTAGNVLGVITPSADPGATPAVLKTNASGGLTLAGLTVHADSATALVVETAGGTDVLVVDTTNGRVGINRAPGAAVPIAAELQVVDTLSAIGDGTNGAQTCVSFGGEAIFSIVTGGGSEAAPTALTANQLLGRYRAGGYNGATWRLTQLGIYMYAAENWGVGSNGTYMTFLTTPTGSPTIAERARLTDVGRFGIGTTAPATVLHANIEDAVTNAVTDAVTVEHQSSGTPSAGFGVGLVTLLESSTTAGRYAARLNALWTDATDASRVSRVQLENYHAGNVVGHSAFWSYNGVAGTALTVIANGTGDVVEAITVTYTASEITGTDVGGGVAVLEPGDSFVIVNDGTNTLTLAVAADGSVTVQRTAGTDTFKVAMWMVWI